MSHHVLHSHKNLLVDFVQRLAPQPFIIVVQASVKIAKSFKRDFESSGECHQMA